MPVATLEADIDVHLTMEGQFFCHRVELERADAQVDDIYAAQLLGVGDAVGLSRVEAVLVIHLRVFEERRFCIVFGLAAHRGRYVDFRQAAIAHSPNVNGGLCTLRDGDETVESR